LLRSARFQIGRTSLRVLVLSHHSHLNFSNRTYARPQHFVSPPVTDQTSPRPFGIRCADTAAARLTWPTGNRGRGCWSVSEPTSLRAVLIIRRGATRGLNRNKYLFATTAGAILLAVLGGGCVSSLCL
jgi:hypothetical protein